MNKNRISYDAGMKYWWITKGTPASIWKDGPLKKRVVYEIETTCAHRFDESDVYYSTKECIVVTKKNQDGELWFMQVDNPE